MDLRKGRVELTPEDRRLLDAFVSLMRTTRAVGAIAHLRQLLDDQELEILAKFLKAPRGESGRWGSSLP